MQGQIIPVGEVGPALVEEWRGLARRSLEPNPWFEPHIVLPLAMLRRDLCLLVALRQTRLTACVVFATGSRNWLGMGANAWLTPHPMGTPLVEPESGEDALRCAFDFAARSLGPRSLTVQEMNADGPVAAMFARSLGGRWTWHADRTESVWPVLRRRRQPTYLDDNLSGKHRYNMGRLWRRLEQHLGSELRMAERSGEAGSVERFLALEASGWKGRRGTALACDPRWTEYFRRACRGFSDEGRLRTFCLESGGTTIAMKVMLQAGRGLIDFRVAYDEQFARFSPGTLLEIEVVRDFHEGDLEWLLSNTNHSSNPVRRIWPERCAVLKVLGDRAGVARRVLRSLARAPA